MRTLSLMAGSPAHNIRGKKVLIPRNMTGEVLTSDGEVAAVRAEDAQVYFVADLEHETPSVPVPPLIPSANATAHAAARYRDARRSDAAMDFGWWANTKRVVVGAALVWMAVSLAGAAYMVWSIL